MLNCGFRFLLLIFVINLCGLQNVYSQRNYGNEWINYNSIHAYYKFGLGITGMHRLYYNNLLPATNSTATIQLFFRGKEVPIFVADNNKNGTFDQGDYIEFWGQKNDGQLDTVLYEKHGFWPDTAYSMYSDTAYYFLTWNDTATHPRRIINDSDTYNSSMTAIPYFMMEYDTFYRYQYNEGIPAYVGYYLSQYTLGEGYIGQSITPANTSLSAHVYATDNYYYKAHIKPSFDFCNISMNDPSANCSNSSPNHIINVLLNGSGTPIFQQKFNGYAVNHNTFQLDTISSSSTSFKFLLTGCSLEIEALAYIKFRYPRTFDFTASSTPPNLYFNYSNPSVSLNFFKFYGKFATSSIRPTMMLYDVNNGIISTSNYHNDTAYFVVHNFGNTSRYYVYDSLKIFKDTSLYFQVINFRSSFQYQKGNNYIIVTNSKLRSAANSYASYKNGQKDGLNGVTLSPLVVNADDLYNEFYYGQHHPAAIQNFMAYLWFNNTQKPQYLFLMGKGRQCTSFRSAGSPGNINSIIYNEDLVPSIGDPPSDLMFISGITSHYADKDIITPVIAVGRLAADSPNAINEYLYKVQEHTSELTYPYPAGSIVPLWHKNILQVGSAGSDLTILSQIKSCFNILTPIATDTPAGNHITTLISTDSNDLNVINVDITGQIISNFLQGVQLFTYFSHGSVNVLGIDIGTTDNMSNFGSSSQKFPEYPYMYLNGCNVGNCFTDSSVGEDYIFSHNDNKGAIIWLSHANFTFTQNLTNQMQDFYSNMFQQSYGKSIGKVMEGVFNNFNNNPNEYNDPLQRSHEFQWILQGDPSLPSPSLPLPDYAITKDSLFLSPSNVISTADSFSIGIPIYNLGLADTNHIWICVQRTLSNSQVVTYFKKIPPVFNRQTIYFTMPTLGSRGAGENAVSIYVNYNNKNYNNGNNWVQEYNNDFANNSVKWNYYIPSTGARLLYPLNYSIVPTDSVTIIAQSRNLTDTITPALFEIDTNSDFPRASGVRAFSSLIKPIGSLCAWKLPIPLKKDSTVFYFRARMVSKPDSVVQWDTRSFTYIKGSPLGWSQSHFQQYPSISPTNVSIDTIHRVFNFSPLNSAVFTINMNPWYDAGLGIKLASTPNLNPGACAYSDLIFMEFDQFSLFYNPNAYYQPPTLNGKSCNSSPQNYQQFNMLDSGSKSNFVTAINNVKNGNYVALFVKGTKNEIWTWGPKVMAAFTQLGAKIIDTIKHDSTTYVLLGRKGPRQGTLISEADQYYPHKTTAATTIIDTLYSHFIDSGTLVSAVIGPASSWAYLFQNWKMLDQPVLDKYRIALIGVNYQGLSTNIPGFQNIAASSLAFSGTNTISAKTYPYLEMKAYIKDTGLSRTPPQLKLWQVLYNGVPEGTVFVDKYYKAPKTINPGDSIYIQFKFKNISPYPFPDSIKVEYDVYDKQGVKTHTVYHSYPPPLKAMPVNPAKDSSNILKIRQVLYYPGLRDSNKIVATVNPNFAQPEVTLDNNVIEFPFYVTYDNINPLLDVTFDGKHILNGELVSAKPDIRIALTDNNKILFENSRDYFKLLFRAPGNSSFDSVCVCQNLNINNSCPCPTTGALQGVQYSYQFHPGTGSNGNKGYIDFYPILTTDGTYELEAQGRDASGNLSGNNNYDITFDVVNKAMVSNFYVYPNPFTNRAKFVFTLTGSQVPDYIKIQIMTITGKVVKEIMKDELGPLVIGDNVSEYTWNGTDKWGAQLANGLYLYRVIVKDNGKELDQYHPAGESADAGNMFDHNFGKLYILR